MTAISEPARRGPGRPFPPGVSGNPSGLSKDIAPLVAEARRLALSHAPKAIETLAKLLDSEDERVRVAAAEGLLDRAGLRPYSLEPERIEVSTPVDLDALRAALAVRVAGLVEAGHLLSEKGVEAESRTLGSERCVPEVQAARPEALEAVPARDPGRPSIVALAGSGRAP